MNLNAALILSFVGYTLAVLIAGAGVAVLLGLIMPSYISDGVRIMFGVMCILYGVFRGASTWMKQRQVKQIEERFHHDQP